MVTEEEIQKIAVEVKSFLETKGLTSQEVYAVILLLMTQQLFKVMGVTK